jgi:N-acetylglutamate synthase
MNVTISEIEAHAHGAIPPRHTESYDGWQLRFAEGHTRRANSVNFISKGTLPLAEKISYCEAAYASRMQPCHFRMTPLADDNLDVVLSAYDYKLIDPTDVLIQSLTSNSTYPCNNSVLVETLVTTEWREAHGLLTGLQPEAKSVFGKLLKSSKLKLQFASIRKDNKMVACGLAASSATTMGLFEFATDPQYRRQGLGAAIVHRLIGDAANQGVATVYLQVVQSNTEGVKFWKEMGFTSRLYGYHYRSRL